MPRIRPVVPEGLDFEHLDQATRVQLGPAAIMAHRPDIAAGIRATKDAINTRGTLPRRLIELLRVRIAFHNQCRSCMAIRYAPAVDEGVTEDLVCSLERPEDAADLTAAERAALRFADLFATDHLAIDDAEYDALRRHFTEGELVEIGLNCAFYVGVGRLTATWAVVDDLPERFRDDSGATITPWGGDAMVVPDVPRVGVRR
jgi:AhpD family alkylhydroperoxidase